MSSLSSRLDSTLLDAFPFSRLTRRVLRRRHLLVVVVAVLVIVVFCRRLNAVTHLLDPRFSERIRILVVVVLVVVVVVVVVVFAPSPRAEIFWDDFGSSFDVVFFFVVVVALLATDLEFYPLFLWRPKEFSSLSSTPLLTVIGRAADFEFRLLPLRLPASPLLRLVPSSSSLSFFLFLVSFLAFCLPSCSSLIRISISINRILCELGYQRCSPPIPLFYKVLVVSTVLPFVNRVIDKAAPSSCAVRSCVVTSASLWWPPPS